MCAFTRKLSATKSKKRITEGKQLTEELEVLGVLSIFDLRHVHEHISDDIRYEIKFKLNPGEITPEILHIDRKIIAGKQCVQNLLLSKEHHEGLLS